MGDEALQLKKLTPEGVKAALEKAELYRLLNEPEAAESICLDILELEAENQQALRAIVLSITDQFSSGGGSRQVKRAKGYAKSLTDKYEQVYYQGLICEREAKGYLTRGMSSQFAYEGFRAAMDHYEEAETMRPAGNDDAILRYNSCLRIIQKEGLKPMQRTSELPLE